MLFIYDAVFGLTSILVLKPRASKKLIILSILNRFTFKDRSLVTIILAIIITSCAHQNNVNTERIPSSLSEIIYTPKQLGYIYIGKTKNWKATMSSPNYVLNDESKEKR